VALIYLQTRMLLVPIVLHAMNNAVVWVDILIDVLFQAQPQANVTVRTLWAGLFNTAMALPILVYFLKWPSRFDPLPYAANSRSQETENSQESECSRNNTLL
jgi:ferric iron reductase protein FhuF